MGNKNNRPVYLNLIKLRLPITGVVSILHRVTGIVLVLLLPPAIFLLQLSLQSEEAFASTLDWLLKPMGRLTLLILAWVCLQHLFSGLRHLFLDIDVGLEKAVSRFTAWSTLFVSTTCTVGLWLWGWL